MHDEACPSYDDMINNMYYGHKFLFDEFNYIPKVAWQLDPFGHSASNAMICSELGYDAIFLGRIDPQERSVRR